MISAGGPPAGDSGQHQQGFHNETVGIWTYPYVSVIGALQAVRAEDPDLVGESLVEAVAEVAGLSPRMVRVAVRYYTAYPAEVDERIAANREAAREAEAAWRAEQNLLRARDQAS